VKARLILATVLTSVLLTACGGEGSNVDCGLDQCTVTFERGVDASASVLGVEAKLVGAEGDKVTVEVAGEQLTLTVGQPATETNGLNVSVESVTDSEVKIKISQ
jgi:hypothetical protein